MKNILIVMLCFLWTGALAQKIPEEGPNKVRIIESDKSIVADLNPVISLPRVKINLFYYWYAANSIHKTQGGYSGKLLNGLYTEYFANKNLKEQGSFSRGLKHGIWRVWNEEGKLLSETNWKNGIQLPLRKVPIWQRLNFLNKRDTLVTDTSKKPTLKP